MWRKGSLLGAVAVLGAWSPGSGGDPTPDPRTAALLEEITAESLLAHVEALVACRTRKWDRPEALVAQEYLRSSLAGLPLDDVYVQDVEGGSGNVVGVLRGGLRPERIHVLGAHYDSICGGCPPDLAPGADDNASGTAAVLEAARAIAGSGLRPAETIVFVLFTAEEVGLIGSRRFMEAAAARGDSIADMIALDVIGYVKPGTRSDLSVSSDRFPPEVDALIARLGEVAAAYLPDWPFEGGKGCG